MERILEPEIMDDAEQAEAYAAADFSTSDTMFVEQALLRFPKSAGCILDIGCGPAKIALLLSTHLPMAKVLALDASPIMVRLAREAVAAAGMRNRVTVVQGYLPGITVDCSPDLITAKDILHHLPDPMVLWDELRRLGRADTLAVIMDLVRPTSTAEAQAIVRKVSGNEPEIVQRDFYNSLLAAFRPEEIAEQLQQAGLKMTIELAGDRHMLISGLVQ